MVRTSKTIQPPTNTPSVRRNRKAPKFIPLKKRFMKDIVPINQEAIPKRNGRPPIYDPIVTPELAYRFCLLGCTDEQLAEALGQNVCTIDGWKIEHSKFRRALQAGKLESDADVIKSVRDRATGYETQEKTYTRHLVVDVDNKPLLDEEGNKQYEMVLTKTNVKSIAADPALAKFWLYNRTKSLPDNLRWTDKQEVDHQSSDGSMTPQETIIVLPAKVMVL